MKDPKVITKTMYVHVNKHSEHGCDVYTCDMSEYGYGFLGMAEVTFTMPEKDPVVAQVECLRAAQKKHNDEAYDKNKAFEEKIQSLLAIGHDNERLL